MIVVTDDLESHGRRLDEDHGLGSVDGGRHEGHGTGNRIVPLGGDYVELMAVVDDGEAVASPLGRWVTDRVASGGGPSAVCLRTDDLDAVCRRLGLEPMPMSRARPDGRVVAWRLAGLEEALGPEAMPFFIEWEGDGADHPGAMEVAHRVPVTGIAAVEIGGDSDAVHQRLGGPVTGVTPVGGSPGIERLIIATADGAEIVMDRPGTGCATG